MEKTYRVKVSNGNRIDGAEYHTLDAASTALRRALGWDAICLSDTFAVGSREGKRGSVYGHAAYETEEARDADDSGAHAPWILVISGDEEWAMGGK